MTPFCMDSVFQLNTNSEAKSQTLSFSKEERYEKRFFSSLEKMVLGECNENPSQLKSENKS